MVFEVIEAVAQLRRCYAPRVELLNSTGDHLRYIRTALAEAMIAENIAMVAHQNGRVRSIKLIASAQMCGTMIGPPSNVPPSAPGSIAAFAARITRSCGSSITRDAAITSEGRIPARVKE